MANFFKGSIAFMEKYFLQILLMVLVYCLITIYMVTNNIHIHKSKHHLVKVATVETFENPFAESLLFDPKTNGAKAFDETCKRDPYECHEMCNSLLDSETCNMSNSCVWTHSKEDEDGNMEEKCVAGNDLGATFNADKYIKTFFNGLEI